MDIERPSKRAKLFSDDDKSSDGESGSADGVPIELGFNQEYAKRFEHNKKRAEHHRLEEKYGKDSTTRHSAPGNRNDDDESDESTDEEEDEEAELANGILDDEFQATLKALKSKDPKIYDQQQKFYSTNPDDETAAAPETVTKQKPLHLSDYHRKNLLDGKEFGEDNDKVKPTYAQEQERLRRSFLEAADKDEDNKDDFLARKKILKPENNITEVTITEADRKAAKDDPDRFLSAFMDSKGWLPSGSSKVQTFESDDEDFDDMQEQFEHSYNMRFETQDNKGKIQTFSRDTAAQHSVRTDATNKRQRAREIEKQKKDAEKQQRAEEKARLRQLKLNDAEEKLKQIKRTAGMGGKELDISQWSSLLVGDWNESEWQKKLEEHFGDTYYAEADQQSDTEAEEGGKKRKKAKKPRFDDDIVITDLVPDFDEEGQKFSVTDEEDDQVDEHTGKKKGGRNKKKEKEVAKSEARKERRKLEALVDEKLDADTALDKFSAKAGELAPFRYRETSPVNFGLSPSEILMASDSQLNEFAGLKRLAAFRDSKKKQKDRRHLGKKARLRKWRKDTFGSSEGPQKSLQDVIREAES